MIVVRQHHRDQVLDEFSRSEAERLLDQLGGGLLVTDEAGGWSLVLDDEIDWSPQPTHGRDHA